jgi:Transposase
MGRRRYSREQWAGWISEQAVSGMGVAAFCDSRELSVQSFYLWRRKLSADDRPPKLGTSFVSVSLTGLAQVEIELPCGATIRLPPDEAATRRVIDALLQSGGGR